MIRVRPAVRVMPAQLTSARTTTTATATGRCQPSGTAYAANVIAIAAQLAVLPTTNPQPARKPRHSPSTSRP